jgi:hypothetical protein
MPLRECYEQIQQIVGDDIEPYASVELVETYRQYWNPIRIGIPVRIILLAESHVFTREDDTRILLHARDDLPGYPTEYAKFVYCLAYGEQQMTGNALHPIGDGTPQFWKIFWSCSNYVSDNEDFSPIRAGIPHERLNNKINLLRSLRDNGVWLLDSSIVALYDNGRRYKRAIDKKVIKTSWQYYTRNVIEQAGPEHIICIGKGVAKILEADFARLVNNYTVIAQPNAHLTAKEHIANFQRYGEICLGQ